MYVSSHDFAREDKLRDVRESFAVVRTWIDSAWQLQARALEKVSVSIFPERLLGKLNHEGFPLHDLFSHTPAKSGFETQLC